MMRDHIRQRAALVAAMGIAILAATSCEHPPRQSPTQGRIAIAVAESHAALLQREADLFESLYPDARVDVEATTTREAFVALLADSVDLVVVDRAPNAEECAAAKALHLQLEEVRLAEDALAVMVQASNRVESLSLAQIADLLCGRTTDWSQVGGAAGPVRIVLTGRNSGAWELAAAKFFPDPQALRAALVLPTQEAVLARVAADPEALGLVSIATWKSAPPAAVAPGAESTATAGWASDVTATNAAVRALAIAGTDSLGAPVRHALHQANVHLGVYPLHYPVYVLFDTHSRLAAGFSAFIASAPGQKLILATGLVPATMPVRLVHLQ
jgi:phosphate transport system substrate-binding protein